MQLRQAAVGFSLVSCNAGAGSGYAVPVGHESGNPLERTNAEFTRTDWSLIGALAADDAAARARVEEELFEIYWPPVYACARRLTQTRDEAAELTQAFFAEVVLERGLFRAASPERGSLRALIKAALKRYAIDRWRREAARGKGRTISLEALGHEDQMLGGGDADTEFDRRWALALLERALDLCERHYVGCGLGSHWALFECRIVHPASRGHAAPPVAVLADRFGFASVPQASAALQTVKRRMSMLIRQVVCETAAAGADADAEHALVLQLLSSRDGDA
jgi:RNA polymerase sigma-70 factor (ECF subfamily)